MTFSLRQGSLQTPNCQTQSIRELPVATHLLTCIMGTYRLDRLLLTSLCPWSHTVLAGSAIHPHFCYLKETRDSLTIWSLLLPLRPMKGAPPPTTTLPCGLGLSSGPHYACLTMVLGPELSSQLCRSINSLFRDFTPLYLDLIWK